MKALQCTPLRAAVYVTLLIAGSIGTAHFAVAQEPTPEQQSAIRSNCRSDFMANCSGVPRGGKEAMQCLKDNVAKLSSGCQQAVKAVMPAPKPPAPKPVTATPAARPAPAPAASAPVAATPPAPAPAAPAAATQTLPAPAAATAAPDAAPPQTPPAQPTAAKPEAPAAKSVAKPPASAQPAAAPPAVIVVAPRRVFALVRTKCLAEYRAHCADVDVGGGRVVACLQANAASLSPTCQSGLAELGR